jgi:hypothetical protein
LHLLSCHYSRQIGDPSSWSRFLLPKKFGMTNIWQTLTLHLYTPSSLQKKSIGLRRSF